MKAPPTRADNKLAELSIPLNLRCGNGWPPRRIAAWQIAPCPSRDNSSGCVYEAWAQNNQTRRQLRGELHSLCTVVARFPCLLHVSPDSQSLCHRRAEPAEGSIPRLAIATVAKVRNSDDGGTFQVSPRRFSSYKAGGTGGFANFCLRLRAIRLSAGTRPVHAFARLMCAIETHWAALASGIAYAFARL